MAKLERLLNLTAVLLNTERPLAADELRQMVEGYPAADASFRRTFERDKDDLRVLGIPLRVEKVPATQPPVDGYRIPADEYYLPDPGLDAEELAAMHLASLTVRLEGLGDQEALWKLGGLPDDGGPASGESLADIPADPRLIPLFSAISDQVPVTFSYRGNQRTIDPWRLSFQRGRWYLSGNDHDRGEERNFRLDRIDDDVVRVDGASWQEAPASEPSGRTLQAWEMGEDEALSVRLLVDAGRAEVAGRQLGAASSAEVQSDGSVIFEVPVVNLDAFRSFVLGFLEHAEILDPPEVRNDLIEWLEALA